MDALIWMAVGALGVVGSIALYTASRKGWDYVAAWLKQRASAAAAKAEADLEAKVKAILEKAKTP